VHKEQGGGDNLSVGWQLPSGTLERPVPGKRLSPYLQGASLISSALVSANAKKAGAEVVPYPNPFTEELTIAFTEDVEELQSVMLYDMKGSIVYKRTGSIPLSGNAYTIHLAGKYYSPGYYILRIIQSNGQASVVKVQKR
ncbi:T9SS type A sorting domain-containing protein, partial [Pontibacter beigongshangensis]|uniref:T9SS type A sorting domain-containing protein n=1 Tax=Pontibacter beigongshangensis TaxID=2574733 RepID=UPI00164FFCE7